MNPSEMSIVIRAKDAASAVFARFGSNLNKEMKVLGRINKRFKTLAATAFKVAAGIALIGGSLSIGGTFAAAANLEEGMLDVQKTANMSGKALDDLRIDFIELTKTMPLAATELANIAAIGGRLGIKGRKDLLAFSETIAQMAIVTDMTAEQAANDMAKISAAMDVPISKAKNMGSVMNMLSNSLAVTAGEISNFTKRAAGQAKTLELTVSETMAFGAVLIATGVNVEVAGTTMSNVFTKMMTDTRKMANAAGIDFPTFAKAVKDQPVEAILMLAESISKMNKMDAAKAIKAMGLEGQRAVGVFSKLALQHVLLRKTVKEANAEFRIATSLQKEYDIFIQGTWNQLKLLKNQIAAVALGVGNDMLPVTKELINNLKADLIPALEGAGEYFKENKEAIVGMVREGYEKFVEISGKSFEAVTKLKPVVSGLFAVFQGFINMVATAPATVMAVGIVGFLLFGPLGVAVVAAIAGGLDIVAEKTAFFLENLGKSTVVTEKIKALRKELNLIDPAIAGIVASNSNLKVSFDDTEGALKDFLNVSEKVNESNKEAAAAAATVAAPQIAAGYVNQIGLLKQVGIEIGNNTQAKKEDFQLVASLSEAEKKMLSEKLGDYQAYFANLQSAAVTAYQKQESLLKQLNELENYRIQNKQAAEDLVLGLQMQQMDELARYETKQWQLSEKLDNASLLKGKEKIAAIQAIQLEYANSAKAVEMAGEIWITKDEAIAEAIWNIDKAQKAIRKEEELLIQAKQKEIEVNGQWIQKLSKSIAEAKNLVTGFRQEVVAVANEINNMKPEISVTANVWRAQEEIRRLIASIPKTIPLVIDIQGRGSATLPISQKLREVTNMINSLPSSGNFMMDFSGVTTQVGDLAIRIQRMRSESEALSQVGTSWSSGGFGSIGMIQKRFFHQDPNAKARQQGIDQEIIILEAVMRKLADQSATTNGGSMPAAAPTIQIDNLTITIEGFSGNTRELAMEVRDELLNLDSRIS